VEWIRLGPRVCFTKRKGLKYKFQHKYAPTIGPRVCFIKTKGLKCKTISWLVSPAGSQLDGAGMTNFQPAIKRLTASAGHNYIQHFDRFDYDNIVDALSAIAS
jgi:hypothetical protein